LNTNYNPILAFELGCQFVAMEFQYIDGNMDYYITKYKQKSFILKDEALRAGKTNKKRTTTTPQTTQPNPNQTTKAIRTITTTPQTSRATTSSNRVS
jgi:hypothetical protein